MRTKSMLDMERDEIIQRLDDLFYGPFWPYIPSHYIKKKGDDTNA